MAMNADLRERGVRAAQNQSLFREVNERFKEVAAAFAETAQVAMFACECADTACIERIPMNLGEYETVRGNPRRFAILPGHIVPDVEFCVGQTDRYWIVEKIGTGAKIAQAADPRAAREPVAPLVRELSARV